MPRNTAWLWHSYDGGNRVEFQGWVKHAGEAGLAPLDSVFLPGPGMEEVSVLPLKPLKVPPETNRSTDTESANWSRSSQSSSANRPTSHTWTE